MTAQPRHDALDPGPAGILLVDDRDENLRALEAVLDPLGRRIVTAQSGHDALRLLLSEQFSVILLDVQMPEMDGFETAAYIRGRARTRTIPIIFLTAISSSPEHVFRGYEAGAVDYIVKPIDPAILRSKVAVFVELHEKSREIARQANLLREQEQERAEREAAERRHGRSRFLAAAAAALDQRLDVKGRAAQLAQTCVPELADFALVQLLQADGAVEVAAVAGRGAGGDEVMRRLVGARVDASALGSWILEAPETRSFAPVTAETWEEVGLGHEAEALLAELEPRALIGAPLVLAGRSLGLLVVCAGSRIGGYGEEETELAKELARKAAMAVENSRLFEKERERSKTLQLSLLGSSEVTSTAVAAAMRYLPGSADLEVGGDWYDVVERDDGRILVVVGDVVGRGVQAATAMGKLRSAMGALGLVVDRPPELLRRLDQFAEKIEEARFGTVAAVLLEPDTGLVRYSLAGHPPPLVVDPDGRAEFLQGGCGVPLCVPDPTAPERTDADARLTEGSTLILYTDGLVERRDVPIDEGLERLRIAVAARCAQEPERLCDEILEEFVDGSLDDVVLLCLRLEARDTEVFTQRFPAVPKSLRPVRHALRAWLAEQGVGPDESGEVVQACGEACANAAQHAYGGERGEAVLDLRLRRDGTLLVRVRDFGRWRPQTHSEFGGCGIEIMRALSDDVHVHVTRYGTTVLMRKRVANGQHAPDADADSALSALP